MSGGYRHKATTSTLFRVEVVVNCLLFLIALGAIPIDQPFVAGWQSHPARHKLRLCACDYCSKGCSIVVLPIDHIAVASQAPPSRHDLRPYSRDLWLYNMLYGNKKMRA